MKIGTRGAGVGFGTCSSSVSGDACPKSSTTSASRAAMIPPHVSWVQGSTLETTTDGEERCGTFLKAKVYS